MTQNRMQTQVFRDLGEWHGQLGRKDLISPLYFFSVPFLLSLPRLLLPLPRHTHAIESKGPERPSDILLWSGVD
jgi:hypothetical protein